MNYNLTVKTMFVPHFISNNMNFLYSHRHSYEVMNSKLIVNIIKYQSKFKSLLFHHKISISLLNK